MKSSVLTLWGAIVLLIVSVTAVEAGIGDPDSLVWALYQNEPNPFCSGSEPTQIKFELAQQAYVVLEVRSPDTTAVVRTLINDTRAAGLHLIVWDGRDTAGDVVPEGEYPYSLTATEVGGSLVLFQDMLVASVLCIPTSSSVGSWGLVKSLFR